MMCNILMKNVISVIDMGAQADTDGNQTAAFQKALDEVWLNGGGTVVVPAGEYRIGGLRIRSDTTLHLCSGAKLNGSRNPEDYMCLQNETLELLAPEQCTDAYWEPFVEGVKRSYAFMRPGGRWSNAMIRIVNARNVTIEGEPDSVIDGCDCYDGHGEEHYRGPHGISVHGCTNIRFAGYTIQNAGNWGHCIFDTSGIEMERVTVLAGHDGIHLTSCENVRIHNSRFCTGDDCVAGFNNIDLEVADCELNTACSALRLGGTNVLVHKCHIFGPGKFFFRGSLSEEEKRNGARAHVPHRMNMLSLFTYYADFSVDITCQPGNIRIEDCTVEHADRFMHYNFSGSERWQANRPLKNITFQNISATGIKMPLLAYGSADVPLDMAMENVSITFDPACAGISFLHAANYARIVLDNVSVDLSAAQALVKTWSRGGTIEMKQVAYPGEKTVVYTEESFVCQTI